MVFPTTITETKQNKRRNEIAGQCLSSPTDSAMLVDEIVANYVFKIFVFISFIYLYYFNKRTDFDEI